MPIFKIQRVKISEPEIKCVYSYRTNKTDKKNLFNNKNLLNNKNYGDRYEFPVNYPSVSEMQNSVGTIGTNLGTIPF